MPPNLDIDLNLSLPPSPQVRLQEGLQGRAARVCGRAAAGRPEPPLPGRQAPPALRRRAARRSTRE